MKKILFVEDDRNDIILCQYALEKSRLKVQFQFVRDGAEAIEYLTGAGQYADRQKFPCPDIIVTDLKMPCLDGLRLWIGSATALSSNICRSRFTPSRILQRIYGTPSTWAGASSSPRPPPANR
ncbi:MAG: hypothetical protein ACXWBP_02600 [Limisphaerales bacterium]